MERGLRRSFHIQAKTTTFRFPSLSRISAVPQSCRVNQSGGVRIFCYQQGHPIDIPVYMDRFAKRMEMAVLKPHNRVDSVALCVLTAAWKTETCDAAINKRSKLIDGLWPSSWIMDCEQKVQMKQN